MRTIARKNDITLSLRLTNNINSAHAPQLHFGLAITLPLVSHPPHTYANFGIGSFACNARRAITSTYTLHRTYLSFVARFMISQGIITLSQCGYSSIGVASHNIMQLCWEKACLLRPRSLCSRIVLAFIAGLFTSSAWAEATIDTPSTSLCSKIPHPDHPKTFLTNGLVDAVVYLPDAESGYYRASRFDWAGQVPCLTYKGHHYFGEWFTKYDPLIHDAITGPVEDWRTGANESAIGYDEARPGDPFVKIGVGVLRKLTNDSYKFSTHYPLIDGGKRTVKIKRRQIVFTQELHGPNGIAYLYTKTLELDAHKPVMYLRHTLKNLGTASLDTEVFAHNFYVIDEHRTDPDMVVRFPFEPKPVDSLNPRAAIVGKDLVYREALTTQPRESVVLYMTGYSNKVSDFDITVENKVTNTGVEMSADVPMSKLHFWSPATTICPEAYVHLTIAPGKSRSYVLTYRFFAGE